MGDPSQSILNDTQVYLFKQGTNLVIVRCYSCWNVETAERMQADFLEAANNISTRPWACLVDLLEWELGGPEVMDSILEINHWCAKNNQRMEAVVCSSTIQEHLLRQLQQALPDTESAFFNREHDALKWLYSNGYAL